MSQDQRDSKKSDFAAAEEIVALLASRDHNEQERIVRWVCESLGLLIGHHSAPTGRRINEIEQLVLSSSETTNAGTSRTGPIPDIRSFADEKKPKTDIQFAALVAYYYKFLAPDAERKDSITTDTLQGAARLAGRSVFPTPINPLSNAVKQGYLDRGARGEFRLNAVGENLVSMTLPGTSAEGVRIKRKRPRSAGKKTKGRNGRRA